MRLGFAVRDLVRDFGLGIGLVRIGLVKNCLVRHGLVRDGLVRNWFD